MKSISEDTIRQKCIQDPWCRQANGFIKFGTVPEWLDNIADMMPGGSQEQQDYRAAAVMAREIYQKEALSTIDPSKVEDICKAEPWTSARRVEDVTAGQYGYVTEKLEKARNLFAAGSPEHTAYHDAFERAKQIYFDDIKRLAKEFATGKTRAQIEQMNFSLFSKAKHFEGNGTYVKDRLAKLVQWNGICGERFGIQSPPDPTRQHFVARFRPL